MTARDSFTTALAPEAGARPVGTLVIGVQVGHLHAIAEGQVALVGFDDGVDGAMAPDVRRARSVVDLHGAHIGRRVVCQFEHGDPARPIVIGVLQGEAAWPGGTPPPQVSVDVDGQRLLVQAAEQLVLRCGQASITLTRAGKVLIEGSYVLSRSTGVNRVKGGSVQLN